MKRLSNFKTDKKPLRKKVKKRAEDTDAAKRLEPKVLIQDHYSVIFDWYTNSKLFKGQQTTKASLCRELNISLEKLNQYIEQVERKLEKIFVEDDEFIKLLSRLSSKTEIQLDENRSLIMCRLTKCVKKLNKLEDQHEEKMKELENVIGKKVPYRNFTEALNHIERDLNRQEELFKSLHKELVRSTEGFKGFIELFRTSDETGVSKIPSNIFINNSSNHQNVEAPVTIASAMQIAAENNRGLLPDPESAPKSINSPRNPRKAFNNIQHGSDTKTS